jgi:DNA-binding CsgD family transcriptional regulator
LGAELSPTVVEQSLHGMVAVDEHRRVVEANQAACVLSQRPRSTLIGGTILEFSAPEVRTWIDERWATLHRDGTVSGRWPVRLPDGKVLDVDYFATANVRPGRHLVVFTARRLDEVGGAADGSDAITEREGEVLRLLALGYNGPEIAERLVVTVDTVRTHIRRLKAKLGARTLPHLIALAIRDGQIPRFDAADPHNW